MIAGSRWSPEVRILMRPGATFRELPRDGRGMSLLARRPALLVFVIGCGVAAAASGRFTPSLIADGAASFAFVPLFHILALRLVFRAPRPALSFARGVDLFFTGNGAWLLWLIAALVVFSVVPARQIGPWLLPLLASLLIPLAWSLWIDVHFFRHVLNRSAAGALRDLAIQRLVGWTGVTLYFAYNSLWPLEQAVRP